jgi:hypothetical protein
MAAFLMVSRWPHGAAGHLDFLSWMLIATLGIGCTDQCHLLREIIGNPFSSVSLHPAWLAWNDGTVVRQAQGSYEERAFDRLPVLADALEEAGCTNAEILAHCRGPGPYVRGCWVVDAVLGKT